MLFSLIQKYQQDDAKKNAAQKGGGGVGGQTKGALKKGSTGPAASSAGSGIGIKLIGRHPPSGKAAGNIFEITEAPVDEENDAASKRRSVTIMSSKGEDGGRASANRESLTDRVTQEVSSPKNHPNDQDFRGSKSVDGHRIKYSEDFAADSKVPSTTANHSSVSGNPKPFNLPKGVNVNIFSVDKMPRGSSNQNKKRKEVSPLFGVQASSGTKLAKNKSYANLVQDKASGGMKTSYSSIRAETLKTPG